jgi:hypothetical protein
MLLRAMTVTTSATGIDTRGGWTRGDWMAVVTLVVLAAALRLFFLADPHKLVFDETYYAKDACYYIEAATDPCDLKTPQVEAHPPLGKWLIGGGIALFGFDSFGWRVSAAVIGTFTAQAIATKGGVRRVAVVAMAPIARMTRATMIEALESDYVRTSRSLGLPARVIIMHHAFKNALLPVLTLIAAVFGYSIGGQVLIELIFSWPGLCLYSYNAILASDFPAILGFIILATTVYILIYLIVDLLSAMLDPRVEY